MIIPDQYNESAEAAVRAAYGERAARELRQLREGVERFDVPPSGMFCGMRLGRVEPLL